MALHNRVSRKELKSKILANTTPRITVSFYCYFKIVDPQLFRDELYLALNKLEVFGRIYLAHEGVNAQISLPTSRLDEFKNYLNSIEPLHNVRLNLAVKDDGKSFYVLDIKVRNKIVSDGISDKHFDMQHKGKYMNAVEFNKLSNDDSTVVIDMRNHYEYEVGHFEKAIEIPSDTFREQLPMAVEMMKGDKDKKIIMYCTGGIRCEKASAFMLHNGFENVFHLEGGIINYIKEVNELGLENKFHGKNFVFDQRLGERITDEIISNCHQCGQPADTHTNCVNDACHLLFIQCEVCTKKFENCCSSTCQVFIHLTAEEQKIKRSGVDKGRNVFNKAKSRLSQFNK